jgi:hypothetical protein
MTSMTVQGPTRALVSFFALAFAALVAGADRGPAAPIGACHRSAPTVAPAALVGPIAATPDAPPRGAFPDPCTLSPLALGTPPSGRVLAVAHASPPSAGAPFCLSDRPLLL